MNPDDPNEKTVFDVLKDKHPEPVVPDHSQFVLPEGMSELPYLQQIIITNELRKYQEDYMVEVALVVQTRNNGMIFTIFEMLLPCLLMNYNQIVSWDRIQALVLFMNGECLRLVNV